MTSYILVSGGLGFIGSHVIAELLDNGYDNIVIVDNLSNSSLKTLSSLQHLYPNKNIIFHYIDVYNFKEIKDIFEKYTIDSIFHMAALKSVGESIQNPLKYYSINITGTLNILNLAETYKCRNFIFSSSATVYGTQSPPLTEENTIGVGITNPYGQTKFMVEQILKDLHNSDIKLNIIVLRYFNPIGAHPSGLLGENPKGIPNNIFPCILRVASKQLSILNIFGKDYNTPDGTPIRDYIDINDLANAHIKAFNTFKHNPKSYNVFNIGIGKGISVLELVNTFENTTKVKVPYVFSSRRSGDLPEVYSLVKAETFEKISWEPKYSLQDSCINAWNFYKNEF